MGTKKQILRGNDLERWRLDNGLVVATAAESFGIPKRRWEKYTSENEIITERRIIDLYIIYTEHPDTVPFPPPPDYVALLDELDITNDTKGWKELAHLLGISLTAVLRVLDSNSATRELEKYVLALQRTGLYGKKMKTFMQEIAEKADRMSKEGAALESSENVKTTPDKQKNS